MIFNLLSLSPADERVISPPMSTLTEIETAVEALPRREQQTLLRRLSLKLRVVAKPPKKKPA